MDFGTIFTTVGFGGTYAVMGAMFSLFLIGTWRRRGQGILMNVAFCAVFVALPFVLGMSGPERSASFLGWAAGGVVALVYGVVVLREDGDERGDGERA